MKGNYWRIHGLFSNEGLEEEVGFVYSKNRYGFCGDYATVSS